jgi:hypothetical protein
LSGKWVTLSWYTFEFNQHFKREKSATYKIGISWVNQVRVFNLAIMLPDIGP